MRSVSVAGVAAVLSMTLCSCGGAGVEVVKGMQQGTAEKKVSQELEKQYGVAPDAVDCPGFLDGKVGTTMRCKLTAGADVLGVTLTVTSVSGGRIQIDVEVDES